eukprot:CAMPEP_0182446990 /NCGR_PEP_ID=MMETSP1172-20130603/9942_1 /TAXON_ID=708627 /ORGANISM="Timspurckia oligopyrenoides, Strain CCMP3278" /LENGTH=93 /DNA_ID=CAMNT_0024643213 /DNA_START=36 /DNA_END=317 /DNA_ORIENTATION=-
MIDFSCSFEGCKENYHGPCSLRDCPCGALDFCTAHLSPEKHLQPRSTQQSQNRVPELLETSERENGDQSSVIVIGTLGSATLPQKEGKQRWIV